MVTKYVQHGFLSGTSVASGLATAAAGLFFGFHPTRQAARLDPIAVLQAHRSRAAGQTPERPHHRHDTSTRFSRRP